MKKIILIFSIAFIPFFSFSQETTSDIEKIEGKFKIVEIDSLGNNYLIKAERIKDDLKVLIVQEKAKPRQNKKNRKRGVQSLTVGKVFNFKLEHWFYKRFIYGSQNDAIVFDEKEIYRKGVSDFEVYETCGLQGLFYKK